MNRTLAGLFSAIFLAFSFQPIAAHSAPLATSLETFGPGDRIHGADISRWQHPNDRAIDFSKMYTAGVRFVMIKASDTRDDADQLAIKYLKADRSAAQSAGIFTGFYHYAILPNVTSRSAIIRDARVQAQKVIWRLASLGGYSESDLPYALDLENNCVKLRTNKSCATYATRSAVTLWTKTFLKALKDKTGRTPIIYSYPNFLENAMVRDKELTQYPLWLAQYAVDPANPSSQPGLKASGCYVHSWTTKNCSSQWIVWQYTSCGIAPKYGVPGTRLDLNVFRGDSDSFVKLIGGTWVPDASDMMPENETSTMKITSLFASTADKNVVISVEVYRPDGTPVVTGDVKFYPNSDAPMNPKPTQTILRSTSGSWKLSLAGVPAGEWSGNVGFKDVSGTHAEVKTRVSFTVVQSDEPSPFPSPTAKISPTPKPSVDTCKNQIKN